MKYVRSSALLMISCLLPMSALRAQEASSTPVKLQTVIGQEYLVKLTLVEIDRTEAANVGLGSPIGGELRGWEHRVLASPKFFNVLKVLEDNIIAKSVELPLITIRSGASVIQSLKDVGPSELTIRSKINEGDIAATVVELATKANEGRVPQKVQFDFESKLGEIVLVRPKLITLSNKSCLLIASIGYANKQEAK